MHRATTTFLATAEHRNFLQSYWFPLVLLLIMGSLVIADEQFKWNDFMDILMYGFVVYLIGYVLYDRLVKRHPQVIRYEFTDDELLIRIGRKKAVRYPLAAIKQWSVVTIEKPSAIVNHSTSDLYMGIWKWKGWELNLFATRKNRMILIDTTQGLLGLTPDLTEEDSFIQELEARTGLAQSPGVFEPHHAQRAGSVWPVIVLAVTSVMSVTYVMEQSWGYDNNYTRALRVVLFIWLAVSFRILYPVQQRFPRLFRGAMTVICVAYVSLLFLM